MCYFFIHQEYNFYIKVNMSEITHVCVTMKFGTVSMPLEDGVYYWDSTFTSSMAEKIIDYFGLTEPGDYVNIVHSHVMFEGKLIRIVYTITQDERHLYRCAFFVTPPDQKDMFGLNIFQKEHENNSAVVIPDTLCKDFTEIEQQASENPLIIIK